MTTVQSIHISAELWGALFCLVIGIITWISYRIRGEKKQNLAGFDFAVAFLLIMDAIAWGNRGNTSDIGLIATRVSNFCVIGISAIIPAILASTIETRFGDKVSFPLNTLLFAIYMNAYLAVFFLCVNIKTGNFYGFDENNLFYRGEMYFFFFLLSGASMIIAAIMIILVRKVISKIEYILLLTFLGFPFVAMIIQSLFYGIQLINLGIGMFAIMFFFSFEINNQMQNLKNLEKIARQEKRIAEQEIEMIDLQENIMLSQIQPHFLYNSLTAIAVLCEKDPKQAKKCTITFANYLRDNMNALKATKPVEFERELEHIKHYMQLELMRFGEDLNIAYDIQTTDFEVPVLGIQPIVENAVKHGIKRKGMVWLSTREVESGVEVIIRDNGSGFNPKENPKEDKRGHVGLENVKQRLKSMVNADVRIDSTIGEGTVVTVFIPHNRYEN